MARNKVILVVTLLLLVIKLQAQDRYMVFFTDKQNSPYSIEAPQEFLSEAAIDRKGRESITEEDLPVNPDYVMALEEVGIEVLHTSKWLNGALVQATDEQLNSHGLAFVSGFEYVAPGVKPAPEGRAGDVKDITSDNERPELTFVQNTIMDIPEMHDDGYNGAGIRIAVLDAGFENVNKNPYFKHAFDDGRVLMTYDVVRKSEFVYSYDDHGAKVFSTFASYVDGSYVGGAYGANFDLFITEYSPTEHRIEEYNWLIAAEKADSAGVDIITTSLGYYDFEGQSAVYNYDKVDLDGKTAIITNAAETAFSKGMLVITSSGNEGRDSNPWHTITFPADGENVLAVGAIDESYELADFSSVGPTTDGRIKPEVVAMGQGVTLVGTNGALTTGSGTSYAAPLVAGLAAGIWQRFPELTNVEMRELIIQSGNRYGNPDDEYGYGYPQYVRAWEIMEGVTTGVVDQTQNALIVYPNPVKSTDQLYINFQEGISNVEIYNLRGERVYEEKLYFTDGTEQIELNNIRNGFYVLKLTYNQSTFQTRFVVE